MRAILCWLMLGSASLAQTLPPNALPPIPSDGLGSATAQSRAALNDCVLNIARMQPVPTGLAKLHELRRCSGVKGP